MQLKVSARLSRRRLTRPFAETMLNVDKPAVCKITLYKDIIKSAVGYAAIKRER